MFRSNKTTFPFHYSNTKHETIAVYKCFILETRNWSIEYFMPEQGRQSIPKSEGDGLQIRKVRRYATRNFFKFWYTETTFPAL